MKDLLEGTPGYLTQMSLNVEFMDKTHQNCLDPIKDNTQGTPHGCMIQYVNGLISSMEDVCDESDIT